MIKVAVLASLFVLMLDQAHAAAGTLVGASATNNDLLLTTWDECVLKRTRDHVRNLTDASTQNHVKTNANSSGCVKSIERDFINTLADANKGTMLEYLRESNTLKDVPSAIVQNFNPAVCAAFVGNDNASRLTADQIKALPNACLDDGTISLMTRAQVQAINPKQAGAPANNFFGYDNFLKHMTEAQLKAIAGNEFDGCRGLDPVQLAKVNPATLAKLNSRCFKNVNWGNPAVDIADPIAATKIAHFVGPDAFKDISGVGLPGNLHGLLKPAQLKEIDSNNREDRCAKLKLNAVQPFFAGAINKGCFKNAFGEAGNLPAWDFFANAGKDLFGDFKESEDLSKLKDVPGVWTVLSKEHYADILKHDKEICESIEFGDNDKIFAYAAELDAECFAKMQPKTQLWILKHYALALKEDILSKLDGTHGAHLEDAIRVIAATRPALLKHFGSGEPGGDNVCSSYKITQLRDPKDLKRAGHYFHENCLKTLIKEAGEEDVQYTELSKYPKNLVALLDVEKLLANLSDSSLSEMDDETKWKAFIGPVTCKGLTYEQFGHVPHGVAYKFMTAACLDELTFLDDLASNNESDIKQIPAAVIGAARAKTIGALASALSEDQIKALGANASGLGDEVFEKLNVAQLGALSAQGVAGLPVSAFKAIKEKDKWLAIKPESLAQIRFEQLDAVPENILLQTTEKQAEHISADAARAFTAERRDKLPKNVQDKLKPLPKEEPKK